MKTTDSKELISALEELEKERGISKEYMLESLENALVMAYRRNFDSAENVKVTMDGNTGEIHVYAVKEIVKDVEDTNLQISTEDAKKIDKKLKKGETVDIEIIPKNFGRIAAGTAKQIIVQKVREAEREILYKEFDQRKGEVVTGMIQKTEGTALILDLGKLEGIMPKKEQIPTETYHLNQKIKGYVVDVQKGTRGNPQVVVSRSHPDFVRKLFELEIPEIYEGLIEIKGVSRDAGSRSKIAVYSNNKDIDPVGSCVGQRGIRIKNIIEELNGEKIDVVEWYENPGMFIAQALLPAEVLAVDTKENEKFAQVIVADNQLSLAIGKAGQNARLAAKLTNWKIDIKSETQYREILEKEQEELEEQPEKEEETPEE